MERSYAFVILACILLLGLSGCAKSRSLDDLHKRAMAATDKAIAAKGRKLSVRERMLNAAWREKEAARREKEAKRGPSVEQIMNSWVGHRISDWIRQKGPATRVADDGAGGQIYIWVEMYQRSVPQIYPSQQTTTRGTIRWNALFERWEYESETSPSGSIWSRIGWKTETYTRRVMFYTRADGTIYHWLID